MNKTSNVKSDKKGSKVVDMCMVEHENESYYKISNHDEMRPFFMNIVSNSNHWMFISSNGGLTAGRKNPEFALFPYYTDDKITEFAEITGSKTIFQIHHNDEINVWEPFSERYDDKYDLSRNLYKNIYGNKIIFEEINHDFGLTFRYQWNSSNLFGFVKKAALINASDNDYHIRLLDGIQNIMPYGVGSYLQMATSNLADAYKRSELHKASGMGMFSLSAIIVDKAEPSEALKANIVWSLGLENPVYLLSSLQLKNFRKKQDLKEELDVKGEKGAYFVSSEIILAGNSDKKWNIVANVNQGHSQIVSLCNAIKDSINLEKQVQEDIDAGTKNLIQLVAGADGLQFTADQPKDTRHFSNVLFNIMRGGTFDNNYQIEKIDFVKYLGKASKEVSNRNMDFLDRLEDVFTKSALDKLLSQCEDNDLRRLSIEYLPLKFSRRHGDPSRPWNRFSINTHSETDGSKILDYEGNWRDIFQNWEALVHSYPDFIEGMIFKFLNATTFDGYNPYRVTKDGFDWETIEPDNPWSYIGYWGDHQIIYLLKFLEFIDNHQPKKLIKLFDKDYFVYANVPYHIKSYRDILKDPKNTIEFDEKSDRIIREKIENTGADGALKGSDESEIYHVNFIEKILATLLAKISNFIPEGGIWMNTQRPEWNDANNALVGNGVSMVTLFYMRRFLRFFEKILAQSTVDNVHISEELAVLFGRIAVVLEEKQYLLSEKISDNSRKAITDGLGQAGSDYRDTIYKNGFTGKKTTLTLSQLSGFVETSLKYFDHTIQANQRPDQLYHSYNLLTVSEIEFAISHLSEMLEGQVAAISSGYLSANDTLKLLDGLRNSALYRSDQNSYLLYPNKELPRFLEKNTIPKASVEKSSLLKKLAEDDNLEIINKDIAGDYHFNGNFKNASDLKTALESLLSTKYKSLTETDSTLVLEIFEEVFNHKAFTGRSGTFFAFEGLGSIYWHMVSKLHLAVNEACIKAIANEEDAEITHRLMEHHNEIGKGIGVHKSPALYGAFPTDPYSHTPQHRGAQQPGMTGQVKEDILVRFGELGVGVKDGKLYFNPCLLRKEEFLTDIKSCEYFSIDNELIQLELKKNSLCFTCCQIPVIYKIADKDGLEVGFSDGTMSAFDSLSLDKETSRQIFDRTGKIKQITVSIEETHLVHV
ncbi:MAG: hypothetical protein Q8J88_00775 [Bacteroidales bacterium]|nr:hypothetical protein [Bacteroidales bacterium]